MKTEKNIVILASGGGSNARAILQYFREKNLKIVSCILSNRKEAGVHKVAKDFEIPSFTYDKSQRLAGEMMDKIHSYKPDLIVLAGYLLKIPKRLVEAFPNKIVNIHPALLPKFGGKGMYGLNVHQAVVDQGETESGLTIHYVNENYDEGQIIKQVSCIVVPGDDAQTIQQKVLKLEHKFYPETIEKLLGL